MDAETEEPMDPTPILPIRAVRIELHFTARAQLRFFHQPLLAALLRGLVNGELDGEPRIWLSAPESGRVPFAQGDPYRFELYCCAGAEPLMDLLVERLQRLPGSLPTDKRGLTLGGNLRFRSAVDGFNGAAFTGAAELFAYDMAALAREVAFYCDQQARTLRFVNPARLLRPKEERTGRKGEGRFVHDRGELRGTLLAQRLADTFDSLLKAIGAAHASVPLPGLQVMGDDIGWYDGAYYDEGGNQKPMGGIVGALDLEIGDTAVLPALVLGQYLGIGQRRTFGWGRYRLETAAGQGTLPPRRPARGVLARAADPANLELAYRCLHDKGSAAKGRGDEDDDIAALAWAEHPGPVDAMLDGIAAGLRNGDYAVPVSRGHILRRDGKAPRPLAVPPFADRVAQRAVMQILQTDVDALMSDSSFGYRRGLSRLQARDRLQSLRREGYEWVYEADIDDFFDSVPHARLETRLRSLLPDDPVVDLLMAWVAAPVVYRSREIDRPAGLPQGAPVSPLLANLMLDDFDADLEMLGFRLVRYADDLVVACRSRAEAEAAAERVSKSLAEVDLKINEAKSGITHFDDGFRFLGYTFLGDLVVEHRRSKRPPSGVLQLEDLPPASWLARLAVTWPEVLSDQPAGTPAALHDDPAVGRLAASGFQSDEPCTLLVATEGSLLSTRNGRLRVAASDGGIHEQPFSELGAVVLIGRQRLTGPSLTAALEAGVPMHFATRGGRYLGVLTDGAPGRFGPDLWLRQQRCFLASETALRLARETVTARIHNQLQVLRQRVRGDDRLLKAVGQLESMERRVKDCAALDVLNGIEGIAARNYFEAIALLLPEDFDFHGRNRRPPRDPFNALLSLGYTLLYQRADTVLRAAGLLPTLGFYHQGHGTHAALASDLIEVFRHLVERQALTMIKRGELKPGDFTVEARGGCRLSRVALRAYLTGLSVRFLSRFEDGASGELGTLYEHLWRMAHGLIAEIDGNEPGFRGFRIR